MMGHGPRVHASRRDGAECVPAAKFPVLDTMCDVKKAKNRYTWVMVLVLDDKDSRGKEVAYKKATLNKRDAMIYTFNPGRRPGEKWWTWFGSTQPLESPCVVVFHDGQRFVARDPVGRLKWNIQRKHIIRGTEILERCALEARQREADAMDERRVNASMAQDARAVMPSESNRCHISIDESMAWFHGFVTRHA